MAAIRPLIAGNWKMNGLGEALSEARAIGEAVQVLAPQARVALCPPATLLERMARELAGLPIEIGGQDCAPQPSGAFTGDVSAAMLADAGAGLVILGHSERRSLHGETDAVVAAKALAAAAAGLEPVICVGETLAERQAGQALEVVGAQLTGSVPAALAGKPLTVAYEPVWAIGAGIIPTEAEIVAVHAHARAVLVGILGSAGEGVAILYGGSVKPANAGDILRLPQVGGALVGGASLKAADFTAIIKAI